MRQQKTMYELYGEIAKEVDDETLIAGRAGIQKYAEPLIIHDVIGKLNLNQNDLVLEIGCGSGLLLRPLSLLVEEVFGIDHPDVITKLNNEADKIKNIHLLKGNWLSDSFDLPVFTKILIYSVIHYTVSVEEAIAFIEKALQFTVQGGEVLIGDIPNEDKRHRFNSSESGKKFNESWAKQRENFRTNKETRRDEIFKTFNSDSLIKLNDEAILSILRYFREAGHEAYLLPQPYHLPFGYTREDILIVKG